MKEQKEALKLGNSEMLAEMQAALIYGRDVYLEGIGTLSPRFIKVKGDYGRNYTIVVRAVLDKEMKKQLLSSYREEPSRFID